VIAEGPGDRRDQQARSALLEAAVLSVAIQLAHSLEATPAGA
jgi:hypothetical protein